MLEYENFLEESFPVFKEHYKTQTGNMTVISRVKRRAIRYLEMNCSTSWGFPAEAHSYSDKNSKSIYMIPTSYDSALLLPLIMNEGVNRPTVKSLTSVLKSSRRINGFWNFFIHEKGYDADLFPDDIDDTSVPMMALYLTGEVGLEECRELGMKMISDALLDQNGVMATWLVVNDPSRKIVHEKYISKPYMCAGCLTNALWFLATIGLDTEPEVIPSVEYVGKWIDVLYENKESDAELEGMVYYTNTYLIYFFISRYIAASENAKTKFLGKFSKLIVDQLEIMAETKVQNLNAMDVACLILAVTTLDLHLQPVQTCMIEDNYLPWKIRQQITVLVNALMTLQNSDGSFAARFTYRWNRLGHYGGSKAYSTGLVLAALGVAEREVLMGSSRVELVVGSG